MIPIVGSALFYLFGYTVALLNIRYWRSIIIDKHCDIPLTLAMTKALEKKYSNPIVLALNECDFLYLGKRKIAHPSIYSLIAGIVPLYLGLLLAGLDTSFVHSGWSFYIVTFFLPLLYLLSQMILMIPSHNYQEKYILHHVRLIEQEAIKAKTARLQAQPKPTRPQAHSATRR